MGVVGEVGRGKHNCIEKVVIKFLYLKKCNWIDVKKDCYLH